MATDDEDEAVDTIRRTVRGLLAAAPGDFAETHRRANRVRDAVREETAAALMPMVKAQLGSIQIATYQEKKDFAVWLNAQLRDSGLAIRCPKTGHPTMLHANPGHTPDVGRFRFDYLDDQGRLRTTYTTVDLPALEFIPDTTVTPRGPQRPGRSR